MGRLKVIGLEKSYGIRTLFSQVNFEVMPGDKVGLVGANGSGKTTLMRILLGREESDAGQVLIDRADTVGYVEQQAEFADGTLYEEFRRAFSDIIALGAQKEEMERHIAAGATEEELSAYGNLVARFEALDGYEFESRIRRVAFGLGFSEEDLTKNVRYFSGGQTTRICLAKALLREPDFLFLDEPTNHLDIGMIEWLEKFLQNYRGGVLLISHDRYFLDRVTTRILELDHREVTAYTGNYTHFMRVKTERRAALQSAYEKQQAHIKKTEEYIRRYKAGIKAKQARGRQSQLNRLERIVLPPAAAAFNYFAFSPPPECAQRVAEMEDISFSYQNHPVLNRISLLIRKGDGVALIGENGAGKTTLLQILIGELEASGRIKIASRVKIGYFNHLDIPAREAVEEALMAFPGTFIAVSHDRYFLDKVANCTLELANGKITEYLGNYSYYLMKKEAEAEAASADEEKDEKKAVQPPTAAKSEKASTATKSNASYPTRMSDAKRRELTDRAEAEIAMAEAELKGLEYEMNRPETQADPVRSGAIAEEYAAKEREIAERYARWERLMEE